MAGRRLSNTQSLVSRIIDSRPHPEQGFRSCLGIIRLATRYSPKRLEKACLRALHIQALSYRSVESILKNRLDQQPLLFDQVEHASSSNHGNIRGKHYYDGKEKGQC
jgi:transposase